MTEQIARAQLELDLQPPAPTFPTKYIVQIDWRTTPGKFAAELNKHFSKYIAAAEEIAPKDKIRRLCVTVLENAEKSRMKAIKYAFAPSIGRVDEVVPPPVPTLSDKIAAKVEEVRAGLEAVGNDSPVTNTVRIARGKDPLTTETLREIERLGNLRQSLAVCANDLASVPAYRKFAEKEGLFTVSFSYNFEAKKSKTTLFLEKNLDCTIDTLDSKLTRVSVIDPLRAEISGIIAKLDNGHALESQKDRIDAVNKASGEVFTKMRGVYAVNAPKDPAAGIEEKVDAALERIRLAVESFLLGLRDRCVNIGTRLASAFERAVTRKTPDATVAPEAGTQKPVVAEEQKDVVVTLTGEEAKAARAARLNASRASRYK